MKVAFALLLTIAAISPEVALASGGGAPWQTATQSIYTTFFASTFVKLVATIAIGACGFMAMAGKMPWSMVINIAIGLAFIFGGQQIVSMISGQ
jgi:type IV secretory pathway VirB2 component (pilin)